MASRDKEGYRFGAYRLDATDWLLYRDGQLIPLPPKVLDTLLVLVANSGRVVAKEEMMKQLWPDTFVEEGTLTQYISHLRKALGDSAAWIENHPRRGYRFTAPVEEIEPPPAKLRIEEHTQSRTVIEEETVTDQGRISRLRIIVAGLGVLVLATAALFWFNRREDAPRSFSSVAVLPFRTVSDTGQDYLADGITKPLSPG